MQMGVREGPPLVAALGPRLATGPHQALLCLAGRLAQRRARDPNRLIDAGLRHDAGMRRARAPASGLLLLLLLLLGARWRPTTPLGEEAAVPSDCRRPARRRLHCVELPVRA
jgi:hypothetical protein